MIILDSIITQEYLYGVIIHQASILDITVFIEKEVFTWRLI